MTENWPKKDRSFGPKNELTKKSIIFQIIFESLRFYELLKRMYLSRQKK